MHVIETHVHADHRSGGRALADASGARYLVHEAIEGREDTRHAIDRIPVGATVVDIGCGAGMDLLLAARRTGPGGRAIGIDMTDAMRRRASQGAMMTGLAHVDVMNGDATRLPVEDRSVDVIISNGVLNLVPEKERAVAEIARVLKPGGRVQVADIVIGDGNTG